MDTAHAIWLALIQGLTEFLPVSSSAHLILPSQLLGWPDQGLAFDVAVHVGTLVAVLIYLRADVIRLITGWTESLYTRKQTDASRLAWCLIIATFPAALAGLIFNGYIEANLRTNSVIATTTILFALLLAWSDRRGGGSLGLDKVNWLTALIVGAAQALALIPGTSRSGITMTAALALGFNRNSAARFSFLMSIPIIALSGGYESLQLLSAESVPLRDIVLGTVISAITAFLCIHAFLRFVERVGMMPFVVYRLILGIALFWVIWSR